jgi:hypothetical protein
VAAVGRAFEKEGSAVVKGKRLAVLVGLVLLLVGGRAEAVSIGVIAPASVSSGQLFTVGVVVSGLGAGAPPTISSFDLDLSFESPELAFVGIAFGSGLGTGAQVLNSFTLLPGPTLDFAGASLLSSATLDANQPASFTLATITFQAGSVGNVALAIPQALLASAAGTGGTPIAVDSLVGANVTIVPEPRTLALVAFGVAALARRRCEAVVARRAPAHGRHRE